MHSKSKQLEQPLRHSNRDGVARPARALPALEGGFVGPVKDKDGRDSQGKQAYEAVEKCANGGIGATWASRLVKRSCTYWWPVGRTSGCLGLKGPYCKVNSNT